MNDIEFPLPETTTSAEAAPVTNENKGEEPLVPISRQLTTSTAEGGIVEQPVDPKDEIRYEEVRAISSSEVDTTAEAGTEKNPLLVNKIREMTEQEKRMYKMAKIRVPKELKEHLEAITQQVRSLEAAVDEISDRLIESAMTRGPPSSIPPEEAFQRLGTIRQGMDDPKTKISSVFSMIEFLGLPEKRQ